MAARKSAKQSSEAAVPVSYQLQFWTVVISFGVVLFQLLYYILSGGWRQVFGINLSYLLRLLIELGVFPLAVFLVAFYLTPRYPVAIGRWFVAVLKSFLVLSVFAMLHVIWDLILQLLYEPVSSPPFWLRDYVVMYVWMVLLLAGMVAVSKAMNRRSGK